MSRQLSVPVNLGDLDASAHPGIIHPSVRLDHLHVVACLSEFDLLAHLNELHVPVRLDHFDVPAHRGERHVQA